MREISKDDERSRKHIILQQELYQRFPKMKEQFYVEVPKAFEEKNLKGSPERIYKCDKYTRTKIRYDTKREESNNESYRNVIQIMQRQVAQIIQRFEENHTQLEKLFSTFSG